MRPIYRVNKDLEKVEYGEYHDERDKVIIFFSKGRQFFANKLFIDKPSDPLKDTVKTIQFRDRDFGDLFETTKEDWDKALDNIKPQDNGMLRFDFKSLKVIQSSR